MPAAAAAAVTSGSLAAPSSIEYSVCTCRWTNESDGLLTGGRAPQWSCVPGGGKLQQATGGEDAVRWVDPRIAEGVLRGSDRTCLLTCGPIRHIRPVRPLRQGAAHRDVGNPRLLVLLADRGVTRPFVEPAGPDLGMELDRRHAAQHRLAVQFLQDGGPAAVRPMPAVLPRTSSRPVATAAPASSRLSTCTASSSAASCSISGGTPCSSTKTRVRRAAISGRSSGAATCAVGDVTR